MAVKSNKEERKATVIIVEGKSELNSLKPIMTKLYSNNQNFKYDLLFAPSIEDGSKVWGDITSQYQSNPKNIEDRIIESYIHPLLANNGHLPYSYISEIIHIVDMDGVFIEDSCIEYDEKRMIKEKPNAENRFYSQDRILTANVEASKRTNEQKRNNINHLCAIKSICYSQENSVQSTLDEICNIPYSIYFFSSNLDHILYKDANLQDKDKARLANILGKEYRQCPEEFIKRLNANNSALINMSYKESWAFIRERGNHSLEPHTNINLLFDTIIKSSNKMESK